MTIAVLALLLPLLAVVLVFYQRVAAERRAAEVGHAVIFGQAVAAVVEGFGHDLESSTLAAAIALGSRDGELDQSTSGLYLRRLYDEYGVLRSLFLTDLRGRIVASYSGAGIGLDLTERSYVRALQAGADTAWGPGLRGLETGEITVTFGRTVRAPDGTPRAYLFAALYPPLLLERLTGGYPPDADITFVDAQGLVLHSTSRPDLPFERRDVSRGPLMRRALAGSPVTIDGDAPVIQAQLFGGQMRFGALVPVPGSGWVVAFTRPLAPLEGRLRAEFSRQAGAIALIMLLAAWLTALVARRAVRPVSELAAAAAAIARGERPRIPPSAAGPEVAQLAAGMAAMSAAVAEREDALRRQSARLQVLAATSRAFAEAGLDTQVLLDAIVRSVAEHVGDGCSIMLASADGATLGLAAVCHPDPAALALAEQIMAGEPRHADTGLAAQLVRRGQPVLVPEITPELLGAIVRDEDRSYAARFGFHSLAAVPLRVHRRTIGAMSLWRDRPGDAYTGADIELLQDVADRAALALDHARLFQEAEERATAYAQLNATLRETAEARDRALAAAQEALRTRDEFVASASHDLKNPLTTVKAAAQAARRRLTRPGNGDHGALLASLGMIDTAASKMVKQIDA